MGTKEQGWTTAEVVALLVLPAAIYVAFWRIDWQTDSLLQYVLPIVFCIAIPSLIGSVVQGAVNAANANRAGEQPSQARRRSRR